MPRPIRRRVRCISAPSSRIGPGDTLFAVIPYAPNSVAIVFASPHPPCFAAALWPYSTAPAHRIHPGEVHHPPPPPRLHPRQKGPRSAQKHAFRFVFSTAVPILVRDVQQRSGAADTPHCSPGCRSSRTAPAPPPLSRFASTTIAHVAHQHQRLRPRPFGADRPHLRRHRLGTPPRIPPPVHTRRTPRPAPASAPPPARCSSPTPKRTPPA